MLSLEYQDEIVCPHVKDLGDPQTRAIRREPEILDRADVPLEFAGPQLNCALLGAVRTPSLIRADRGSSTNSD
jgi:hypothetical protein